MKNPSYNTPFKIYTASLLVFLFTLTNINAQTESEFDTSNLSKDDIVNSLPPLKQLIESAQKNSPLLKVQNADQVISDLKIESEKKDWMKYLGFEAGARYGLFDNLILRKDLGGGDLNLSTSEETRYYLGVFLKIPLSSFLDKSNLKIARKESEKAAYKREILIKELRQLVIIQYYNVIKAYKTLAIRQDDVDAYRVQMLRADKDFVNGEITVADYARLREMLSRSQMNLEENRMEFLTSLLLLQETVGVKIELNL